MIRDELDECLIDKPCLRARPWFFEQGEPLFSRLQRAGRIIRVAEHDHVEWIEQMLPRADWRMPHLASQRDSFRLATGGLKRAVIVAERRFDDADFATGKKPRREIQRLDGTAGRQNVIGVDPMQASELIAKAAGIGFGIACDLSAPFFPISRRDDGREHIDVRAEINEGILRQPELSRCLRQSAAMKSLGHG